MEPLETRLHHEADKRNVLREKAKELIQADQMCAYTFQPQINQSSQDVRQTPIHLRTTEIRQHQEERARERQAAEDARSDCSFQPRISARSDRMVRHKREELYRNLSQGNGSMSKLIGPVEDRLYADAQEMLHRRVSAQSSVDEASQRTPSVDGTSRRICQDSVYFQGAQQDFVTRQQTFELAKQRRQELRSQHADARCTFRPEISDTSRQIVSSNIDYVGETVEERVNRLAVRDVERRNQTKAAVEELHYKDCTFRPSLNATSQMLATRFDDAASLESDNTVTVHERLYKVAQNKPRSGDDLPEKCTFQPTPSKSSKQYAHVKSHYHAKNPTEIMSSIQDELQKKEEHLNELRKEREEAHYTECSFHPKTTKAYEEPNDVVVVSGLGRFFELRDLARKQDEEQRKREAKVFNPSSKTRCDGITIPEPFALSSALPTQKYENALGNPRDECTFHPQTNESENQKLLRRIMNSDSTIPELPSFAYDAWESERKAPLWSTSDAAAGVGTSNFVDLTAGGLGSETTDAELKVPERYHDRQVDAHMAALLARLPASESKREDGARIESES